MGKHEAVVPIERALGALAPKLITWLATGFTASVVFQIAAIFGLVIPTDIGVGIALAVSTFASWLKTDNRLYLPLNMLAPKVVTFLLTSVTGAGLIAFLDDFDGVNDGIAHIGSLPLDVVPTTLVLTFAGGMWGYFVKDTRLKAVA
jgi:hypothetical protein